MIDGPTDEGSDKADAVMLIVGLIVAVSGTWIIGGLVGLAMGIAGLAVAMTGSIRSWRRSRVQR